MGILSFLFTIFIFLIVFVFVVVIRILNGVFGLRKTHNHFASEDDEKRKDKDHLNDNNQNKKKIYDQDDGEYVDYEEIKDK